MWGAIISLVGSVFGGLLGANKSLLAKSQADLSVNLNYERTKEARADKMLNMFNYVLFGAIALVIVVLIIVIIKK